MGNKTNSGTIKSFLIFFFLVPTLVLIQGCSSSPKVIAVTGTNIGVEISQNPATQTPQAKLGYQRTEIALVPTNRPIEDPQDVHPIKGAEETAEVVMELKYAGIFSWGDGGGIYQRLAVGKTAVAQPGAAVMFTRDVTGHVNNEAAKAVSEAQADSAKSILQLGQRSEGVVAEAGQNRVDKILDMIDLLDDAKAHQLAKNPAVPVNLLAQTTINSIFQPLDRNGDDIVNPSEITQNAAKQYLKTLAAYSEKSEDELKAWESVLNAMK